MRHKEETREQIRKERGRELIGETGGMGHKEETREQINNIRNRGQFHPVFVDKNTKTFIMNFIRHKVM